MCVCVCVCAIAAVITMRSGVTVPTPLSDLQEIRHVLQLSAPRHRSNPLFRHLIKADLPWMPCVSAVAGWYASVSASGSGVGVGVGEGEGGLESRLVAHNSSHYAALASRLAEDRYHCLSLPVCCMTD